MRFDWRRLLQWTLPCSSPAGPYRLLGPALLVPPALCHQHGYQKITTYLSTLFPQKDLWLFILAFAGAVLAVVRRNQIGTFLAIMTFLSAVVFRIARRPDCGMPGSCHFGIWACTCWPGGLP